MKLSVLEFNKTPPRGAFVVSQLIMSLCVIAAHAQEIPQSRQRDSGAVRGTITYAASPQRPWRLGRFYIRNAKSGELSEAVVAISQRGLQTLDAGREPKTVTVDQKDFQFSPETVAIRAGDRIKFLNSDNHPHNVRTTHPEHPFNVTMPVGSEHLEIFKVAGGIHQPYEIDCVFHSAMRSWVFVFDHTWFYVTGKDGAFQLQNVPPGEYRLEVVHAAGDLRARQTIRVTAGETLQVDVKLQPTVAKP